MTRRTSINAAAPPTTESAVLSLAHPQDVGLSAQRTQTLLRVLQDEIDRNRLPGAVALIARHGKVALLQALGNQVPAKPATSTPATAEVLPVPMTADAIFRIYSMSKPVTSVAVLMLMEQGRLLLSDPVAKHLPEFAHQQVADVHDAQTPMQPVHKRATVQDLLRHTAGLTYEFLGNNTVQKLYTQARIRSDLRDRTNAEMVSVLAPLPLIAQPGTVWEYSRATDVLGRLVEVLSGQTLGEFLHQNIFTPLGMVDTGFSVPPEQQHRIAEPFAKDPEGAPQMRVLDAYGVAAFESGGGGLMSTAADYARFLQCLLNKGEFNGVRLLGCRTVDHMTADHLGSIPVNAGTSSVLLTPGHGFGLGVAVRTATGVVPAMGSIGSYFWGGLAGTTFFVDPALDLFAILMLQAPNQREYYRELYRNLVYAAVE